MADARVEIMFLYRRKGMTGIRILGGGREVPVVIGPNDNWELFAWIFRMA